MPNSEKSTPLLSILIPTFNRASCLQLNLDYLIPQVDESLFDKIQILVADNFSSDYTQEILKKYESYSFFTSLETQENIGPELNFLKLIKKSSGKFVWIFGDDEVLYPNSLKKIISVLEQYQNVGLVHITQSGHIDLESFNPKEICPNPSVEVFEDSALFLEKVSYNLSFITSNIYNSTFINSEKIPPDFFLGTLLNQEGFYLQAALKSEYNVYISDRIFSQLLNNTGDYALFSVFAVNHQKILNYFKQYGLQDKTIRKMNNDLLRTFFPTFILLMAQKSCNGKELSFKRESVMSILFSSFKGYKAFWIYCAPLLLLPSPLRLRLFNIFRRIKTIFKKLFK